MLRREQKRACTHMCFCTWKLELFSFTSISFGYHTYFLLEYYALNHNSKQTMRGVILSLVPSGASSTTINYYCCTCPAVWILYVSPTVSIVHCHLYVQENRDYPSFLVAKTWGLALTSCVDCSKPNCVK